MCIEYNCWYGSERRLSHVGIPSQIPSSVLLLPWMLLFACLIEDIPSARISQYRNRYGHNIVDPTLAWMGYEPNISRATISFVAPPI